jgi:hypothetical protein
MQTLQLLLVQKVRLNLISSSQQILQGKWQPIVAKAIDIGSDIAPFLLLIHERLKM